jgi:hypothetical protein
LTPAAVRKQIKDGTPDAVYLLTGEDELEKSALAAEFAELVEDGLRAFNVERIHAGEWTSGDRLVEGVGSVVAAARTLPMMAPRRVVTILRNAADAEAREEPPRGLERLESLLKAPEPQTTLVLVPPPSINTRI